MVWDVSDQNIETTLIEEFYLLEQLSKFGYHDKLAIIHLAPQKEDILFRALVAGNRGVNMKCFLDQDAAIKWVVQKSD